MEANMFSGKFLFHHRLRTCVPMVLAQLLIQLKDGAKNQETNQFILPIWDNLFWLAGLICLMMLVSIVISHHSDLRLQMTGARMRIACCSLIYRKVLQSLHLFKIFNLGFHVNDFKNFRLYDYRHRLHVQPGLVL